MTTFAVIKKTKIMYIKRIFIIICIIIVTLLAVALLATRKVDRTSYYECDYYKQSIAQLESLRKNNVAIHHSFAAGFSKVSITPELNCSEDNIAEGKFKNVPLAGYGSREGKFAAGVNDSIFIRAAAVQVADQLMVIVGADLLIMPHNITDTVLSMLHRDGIGRDQLMFSATHTHSSIGGWGIGTIGSKFAGTPNENMVRWLASRITLAVRTAIKDLKPALIGSGNVPAASYTRNRILGDLGTKNDDFSYIVLEQIEGKKAVIGSFSAHATTIREEIMEISGDYPGYWSRAMESAFADCAIFCAGGVGSQATQTVGGENFERAQKYAHVLADTVTKCIAATPMDDSVIFSAITMKLNLPDFNIRILKNRSLISKLSNKMLPAPKYPVLQAMRLNDMIWVSAPSDFSGEIALQTKNYLYSKGFNANVIGFNGSYVGYIIPSKYFFLDRFAGGMGLYESRTMGWFGPNMGDYTADLIRQLSEIVIR